MKKKSDGVDQQTAVNTDFLLNIVAEGEIENVYDSDIPTEPVE